MFFVSCVSHAFASVHCCFMVTCWERANLLALVGDVYCIFVTFPCGILGQVWFLTVSFPDLCLLITVYLGNNYSKTCLERPLPKRPKISFLDYLLLNAGQKYCRMLLGEHSAILSTCIKVPFVIKIFVL